MISNLILRGEIEKAIKKIKSTTNPKDLENNTDEYGNTILMLASGNNIIEIVTLLLSLEVDCNKPNPVSFIYVYIYIYI